MSRWRNIVSMSIALGFVVGVMGISTNSFGRNWQEDDIKPAVEVKQQANQDEEKKPADDVKQDETPEEEMVEAVSLEVEELGPREVRFHLWDGSIVSGDVSVSAIHIKTKFGMLEVPVANIVSFQPGMNSLPDLKAEIDTLVTQLGDREFQTRERAKQTLLGRGVAFYDYLSSLKPEENAELKKNLTAILESLAEEAADSEFNGAASPAVTPEDSITTGTFTIVGEIQEGGFDLATPYGDLKIGIKDIKAGDRAFRATGEVVTKKVDVDAVAFFQRTPKATKIRVNTGDRISIRATGTVQWASWGDITSTPEGLPNHGVFEGIPSGTLIARIGKSNEYIKIGNKNDFVAKSSGELILGIAIQENYSRQNGYQWNGNYTASIRVESGKK